jgi:hypothetical protein
MLPGARSTLGFLHVAVWVHSAGQSKAITELEYREAKRLGLKCLIFLLDETVPWPPLLIDEDAAKIKSTS